MHVHESTSFYREGHDGSNACTILPDCLGGVSKIWVAYIQCANLTLVVGEKPIPCENRLVMSLGLATNHKEATVR